MTYDFRRKFSVLIASTSSGAQRTIAVQARTPLSAEMRAQHVIAESGYHVVGVSYALNPAESALVSDMETLDESDDYPDMPETCSSLAATLLDLRTCTYCGLAHPAEQEQSIPRLDDDEAWEALGQSHEDGCEWIATRGAK